MTQVLNPEPLLRALHEAGVRHVIIGGFAVNAHGVIRPSKDLDIVPDPDPRGAVQAVRAGGMKKRRGRAISGASCTSWWSS